MASADATRLAVAGRSAATQLACCARLPMSNHSKSEETLSKLAIEKTLGAAIGTVLALGAIATALINAFVYPALDGHVIALAIGMGVAAIALAGTIAATVLYRLRLPSNNDAWVYW